MKSLGIVGGIGPESTIEYYRFILDGYRARVSDNSAPHIIIDSIDVNRGIAMLDANDLAALADYVSESVGRLTRAGAEIALIAANTPHIVFDEIAPKSPIPLISIVEATRAAAKARNLKRLALFGTRYTMQANFYPKVFAREGIELLVPDTQDQDYIHEKYFSELVPGKFLPETRAGLLAIVDRMKTTSDSPSQSYGEAGIDGVILAGTELPLILRDPIHHGIPFLDTTKIHVEAAVAEMLS